MLKDKSGQLMLISAFLMAMMVVMITLMLNNVIYSSNMAYVGFMDQSRYDDLSFKQATANEAEYAAMHDTAKFPTHMDDYERSLNNITSIKGRYVELDSTRIIPNPPPLPVTHTMNKISIYGKGSNASYTIYTGWDGVTVPGGSPPAPGTPPAGGYVVDLTPSKYNVISGPGSSDRVTLTLIVSDHNGTRMPNVPVSFYFTRVGANIVWPGTTFEATNMTSGPNGVTTAEYYDVNNTTSTVPIWATAGSNTSNIVYLNCGPVPPTCTHNASLAASTPTTTHVTGNNYEVKVLFNFTGFTNDTIPSISVLSQTDTVITGVAPSYDTNTNMLSFTIRLTSISPYEVQLGLEMKAHCDIDALAYDRNAILTIQGTKDGVTYSYLDIQ